MLSGCVLWREWHPEPNVCGEPSLHELAAMNADIVGDQVDQRDRRRSLTVDLVEQLDELDLSLAGPQDSRHLAGPRVERGEQVQRALAYVLVLDAHGFVWRPRRLVGRSARTGLQRCLLVDGKHALVRTKRSSVQVADVADGLAKRFVARHVRAEPVVDPPRLQLLRRQDSLHGRRRDRKSTRLNSSHVKISYAVFCLKNKSNWNHY